MASNSDDDVITLICENPNSIGDEDEEILISTSDINTWNSTLILSYQTIKIQAHRSRLIEQSSYFNGLLSRSFRESYSDCILIQWDPKSFIYGLKYMYGCSMDITLLNFIPLFEAGLFFGVETLLFNCKSWLSKVLSPKGPLQIQLDKLTHIWSFSMEHANDVIQGLCVHYLARNFMWAMSCDSFFQIPYNFLLSCIKHLDLTIDSEKYLCDAVQVWLTANMEQFEILNISEHDWTDLVNQVRSSILPFWYLQGKRDCRFISKLADKSILEILSFKRHIWRSSMAKIADNDLYHLRIRLTEYTKKVNLSDFPQVIVEVLTLSVVPFSYVKDPMWSRKIKNYLMNLQLSDEDQSNVTRELLPIMCFEAVQEVDICKCSRLDYEVLIDCLYKAFPSLRILKATYLLNFKATLLLQLMQKCGSVSEVDLTVDVTPVIKTQVSVLSSTKVVISQDISSTNYSLATSFHSSRHLLPNITKLTLEGRSDVTDVILKDISRLCISLSYLNLNGCISVTDVGISILIGKCVNLHSVLVCDTTFGMDSVKTLCSSISKHDDAHHLQMLHIGGCRSVDEASLVKLMSQTPLLKSLCLRDTNLVDQALYNFGASSLEMLDVSNTMVSGAALAHAISGSSCLKRLKARGCKNLHQTFKEPCIELGNSCKLDEISLGWGCNSLFLETLKPAMASLKEITIGIGGSLDQNSYTLLTTSCPLLQSLILYFQVISDSIMINILTSLRDLQVLALCYCLGDVTRLSFQCAIPNLRKLKLQRVTPWMRNDDLVSLTRTCPKLIELSLLGCRFLNSDSQVIIWHGWPGLISIHLEECGGITANGVGPLLDCKGLEDLLLRHNGAGIQKNFIMDAIAKMPMLRKISLDLCDACEGEFEHPNHEDCYSLSIVKIARCKSRKCSLDLQILKARTRPVHNETTVLEWSSTSLTKTVITERV